MGMWINWFLVIIGIVCAIVEIALGAVTGFDLALVGASLAVGGAIGLFAGSYESGLIASAVLALLYFLFFRSWLKSKLAVKEQHSNVDAVLGRTGVVTKRIGANEAGIVKIGTEEWRAELADVSEPSREIGASVTVSSVEGVTLRVR